MRAPLGVLFSLALNLHGLQAQQTQVRLRIAPLAPLVEFRAGQQLLNFEITETNATADTLRLTEVEMTVYDQKGNFVMRKTVNSDGLSPGIEVVATPLLAPGEVIDIFNPFWSLAADVPIASMRYALRYVRENTSAEREINRHRLPIDFDVAAEVTVIPQRYETKTNLILPLQGRVFVWEGHDFYSHHRRIPLHDPKVEKVGIRANANRYASDLVLVDPTGRMWHGDPYNKKNWLTYGAPIYAPADGIVAGSENRFPDNAFEAKRIVHPQPPPGADEILGNYVLTANSVLFPTCCPAVWE